MKTKKLNLLLLTTSILFAQACSTPEHRYSPVAFNEPSDFPFHSSFNQEWTRFPANSQDCLDSIIPFIQNAHPANAKVAKDLQTAAPKTMSASVVKKPIRYPKGFENIEGSHIQYGFESEYLHENTEAFFINYMPDSSVYGETKEKWLSLTHAERLKWVDDNTNRLFGFRTKAKFIKITEDPELINALPDTFVYDVGHFELVLDPMNSAEEMITKIKVINKHFGIGSMQVMISNPIDKILLAASPEARVELKAQLKGYYNFINDFDTINKINTGYERYLKEPNSLTLLSFIHPWLGPMNKIKHVHLESFIDRIVDQTPISAVELDNMTHHIDSHKFIGGQAFRPDVAYSKGRIAAETRDCHKNIKCIEDRIIRETFFLMKGKKAFEPFAQLKPFDTIESFTKLPADVQTTLKKIFPAYQTYTNPAMQFYRNFSYPLRDWSQHIATLNSPQLAMSIKAAQEEYVLALTDISKNLNASTITVEEAKAKAMGAIEIFVNHSGISEAMNDYFNHLVDPAEIKLFNHLKFTMWKKMSLIAA